MHEIGLVKDIITSINSKLNKIKPGSKIKVININIGELEHVVPGHFEFHFKENTKGTVLENAELNIKRVKVKFRCRGCGYEFSAEDGLAGCPKCNYKASEVIAGSGIYVESIETNI